MIVGAFNQKKALVGAFSMIVKTDCETDGALHSTIIHAIHRPEPYQTLSQHPLSRPNIYL